MDIDIYEGLDDINLEEELNKVRTENEVLNHKLSELDKIYQDVSQKYADLKAKNDELETNFSSLFKTAYAEVARKDRIISELREEKDNFIFKRECKTQHNNYNTPPMIEEKPDTSVHKQRNQDIDIPRSGSYVPIENFKHLSKRDHCYTNTEASDENRYDKYKHGNEYSNRNRKSSERFDNNKSEHSRNINDVRNYNRKRPRTSRSPIRNTKRCFSPRNSPPPNSYRNTDRRNQTSAVYSRSRSKENNTRNFKRKSKSPLNRNEDHRTNQYNNIQRGRHNIGNFNRDRRYDHSSNRRRMSPLSIGIKSEHITDHPMSHSELFGENPPKYTKPVTIDMPDNYNRRNNLHKRNNYSPQNDKILESNIKSEKTSPPHSFISDKPLDQLDTFRDISPCVDVKTSQSSEKQIFYDNKNIKKDPEEKEVLINFKNDIEEGEVSSEDELFQNINKNDNVNSNQIIQPKLPDFEMSDSCKTESKHLPVLSRDNMDTDEYNNQNNCKVDSQKINLKNNKSNANQSEMSCEPLNTSEQKPFIKHQRKIQYSISMDSKDKSVNDESSKIVSDSSESKKSSSKKESTIKNEGKIKDLFTDVTKKHKKHVSPDPIKNSGERKVTEISHDDPAPKEFESKTIQDAVDKSHKSIPRNSRSSEDDIVLGKEKRSKSSKAPHAKDELKDEPIETEKRHLNSESKEKSSTKTHKQSKTSETTNRETSASKQDDTNQKKVDKNDKAQKSSKTKVVSVDAKVTALDAVSKSSSSNNLPMKNDSDKIIKLEKSKKDDKTHSHHSQRSSKLNDLFSNKLTTKNDEVSMTSIDNSKREETDKTITESELSTENMNVKKIALADNSFTKSVVDKNTVNLKLSRKRNTIIKK